MERYKAILSSNKLYREVDLEPEIRALRIGTDKDSAVRFDTDMFFEEFAFELENDGENWALVCGENNYATADGVLKVNSKSLTHGDSVTVKYRSSNQAILTVNFVLDFEYEYKDYERVIDVADTSRILIGGAPNCNIRLEDPLMGGECILVENTHGQLVVHDNSYQYGVYVNGVRIQDKAEIKDYDFFSVIGYSFYYKFGKLYTSKTAKIYIDEIPNEIIPESDGNFEYPCFNRNTRVKDPIPDEEISILDPPQAPEKNKQNVLLQIIPTIAMAGVTVMMASMNSSGSGMNMAIRSIAMVGVTLSVTALGIFFDRRDFKKDVKKRDTTYRTYIDRKKSEIQGKRQMERSIREEIFCSPEIEIERVQSFSSDLFDRIPEDSDFIHIRVGTGAVVSSQSIAYKEKETLETLDELMQLPAALATEYKCLPAAPIVVDGRETGAIGIVGSRPRLYEMLKNVMLDISTRHYYDDVQMFLLVNEELAASVGWTRFLPHLYNETMNVRNIVCDEESKNALFEYLYKELSRRESEKITAPRIVIFCYVDPGLKSHPISNYFPNAAALGVTFLFFEEKKHNLPLGCGKIIILENSDTSGTVVSSGDNNQNIMFSYDPIDEASATGFVQKLAPVYCEEVSLESNLTKSISLFELLNIYDVQDLNLEQRWLESEIHKSMAAPLGVNAKNDVVALDLHEKYHGPHGLVAGTTGSGKSEILQSYILSMATLFHPYEVGFVIIDFKGGGMVNQFKSLPHLVGAITNIDGKEIDRSLQSIKAELEKRQRLFAQAEVNHINAYIKKYKAKGVSEPIPHLIIIVDEFAELKAEQPEFMKELISAARIGRSLGVHLILATQKPAGQVNEQIWSNSKFKLCLKVQTKEDSNEVIKSPLAAEIREPGRTYLQVGNNEIFELFQSAYSGASATKDSSQSREFIISEVSFSGRRNVVFQQKKSKSDEKSVSQLEAIVDYVAEYCHNSKIEQLPSICLPTLEKIIGFPEDAQNSQPSADIMAEIGIYDDPSTQYQGTVSIGVDNQNVLIIGSAQSGKTNLLQTIIRSVASQYTASEVNFYIIDFGSMLLKNFEELNHVGGVVCPSEDEKLKNLFKLLHTEIATRKDKLVVAKVSSFASYKEAGYTDLPQIVLVIDNYTALKELYLQEDDLLLPILRDGLSVGISVVMANANTSGMGFKYLSNMAQRVALYCNDSGEYSSVFDRCRMVPDNTSGRGLVEIRKSVYEYQTYLAFSGEREIDRVNLIYQYIERTNQNNVDKKARSIPEIPGQLTEDVFVSEFPVNRKNSYVVSIGLEYDTIAVSKIDLLRQVTLGIIGRERSGKTNLLSIIFQQLRENMFSTPTEVYLIDSIERQLKPFESLGMIKSYTLGSDDLVAIIDEIYDEMKIRFQKISTDGIETIKNDPLQLVVIQNREVIADLSKNTDAMKKYKEIVTQFRNLKVCFIFSDIEDAAISYSGVEILKMLKESKTLIYLNNISEMKFCDVPNPILRMYKKEISLGDAYYFSGNDVKKIKTVKAKGGN